MTSKLPIIDPTDRADGKILEWDNAASIHKYVDKPVGGSSVQAPGVWVPHAGCNVLLAMAFANANSTLAQPATLMATVTVTGLRIRVGTSSGNISVALYDSSFDRVATSGSVACPSTVATVEFTSPYEASPGLYYFALSCNNTSATFGMVQATSGAHLVGPVHAHEMQSNHPAPTTFTPGAVARTPAMAGIITGGWTP